MSYKLIQNYLMISHFNIAGIMNNSSTIDKQSDKEPSVIEDSNRCLWPKDINAQNTDEKEDTSSRSSSNEVLNNNTISTSKRSTNVPSLHPSVPPTLTMEEAKELMLSQYIPWVNSTYGDTAKTKTITKKKYSRIIALLRFNAEQKDTKGAVSINSTNDPSSTTALTVGGGNGGSELAKFKLWVKSKGFHLGPPEGHPDFGSPDTGNILYLPTGTDKVSAIHFKFYLSCGF